MFCYAFNLNTLFKAIKISSKAPASGLINQEICVYSNNLTKKEKLKACGSYLNWLYSTVYTIHTFIGCKYIHCNYTYIAIIKNTSHSSC